MEKEPAVGDIWRWHGDSDEKSWTVLLIRESGIGEFEGIALEDGWRGIWQFKSQFGGKLAGWWEYLA